MGEIVPFRKRKSSGRWTRPEDYGHSSGPPGKPPKRPRKGKRRWLRPWMFWLVVSIAVGLWVAEDPALFEPPAALASEPETVGGRFTICGDQRSQLCVIDGDTIRIGNRSIRLIGIDAPEIREPSCEAERVAGVQSTRALQALLNEAPFEMVGRIDAPVDQYGRELRALSRVGENGERVSIAEQLVAAGHAQSYRGGWDVDWCSSTGPMRPGVTSSPAQAS